MKLEKILGMLFSSTNGLNKAERLERLSICVFALSSENLHKCEEQVFLTNESLCHLDRILLMFTLKLQLVGLRRART